MAAYLSAPADAAYGSRGAEADGAQQVDDPKSTRVGCSCELRVDNTEVIAAAMMAHSGLRPVNPPHSTVLLLDRCSESRSQGDPRYRTTNLGRSRTSPSDGAELLWRGCMMWHGALSRSIR